MQFLLWETEGDSRFPQLSLSLGIANHVPQGETGLCHAETTTYAWAAETAPIIVAEDYHILWLIGANLALIGPGGPARGRPGEPAAQEPPLALDGTRKQWIGAVPDGILGPLYSDQVKP